VIANEATFPRSASQPSATHGAQIAHRLRPCIHGIVQVSLADRWSLLGIGRGGREAAAQAALPVVPVMATATLSIRSSSIRRCPFSGSHVPLAAWWLAAAILVQGPRILPTGHEPAVGHVPAVIAYVTSARSVANSRTLQRAATFSATRMKSLA
jgi:hypothetical protein